MQVRLAFRAGSWGGAGVVCPAAESRSGRVVDQRLARYEPSIRAPAFATQVNQNWQVWSAQERKTVSDAMPRTGEILHVIDSAPGGTAHLPSIAGLGLAIAFCGIIHFKLDRAEPARSATPYSGPWTRLLARSLLPGTRRRHEIVGQAARPPGLESG
jgi:hypothetical protein